MRAPTARPAPNRRPGSRACLLCPTLVAVLVAGACTDDEAEPPGAQDVAGDTEPNDPEPSDRDTDETSPDDAGDAIDERTGDPDLGGADAGEDAGGDAPGDDPDVADDDALDAGDASVDGDDVPVEDGVGEEADADPLGVVCVPCESDEPCGDDGACTELGDGHFCGLDCSADPEICGDEYACVEIPGEGEDLAESAWLCLPATGFCARCPDGYLDELGDGTSCLEIDECAGELDDCDPLVTCDNLDPVEDPAGRFFDCGECPEGYLDPVGDGRQCDNVDECTEGVDNCDPVVVCVDLVPAEDVDGRRYRCEPCPERYVDVNGDGTSCTDVLECAADNGGCGDATYWDCVENVGAPPTCSDLLECAVDNGGCGDAAFWSCIENEGAAPSCQDVLECATDNGGCGDPLYWDCVENEGAAPTCVDVLECAADNGGCGDAAFWDCVENEGAAPTCVDVLECAVDNGGCGDVAFRDCVENEGAAPTCVDVLECEVDNGGCGNPLYWDCVENEGAAPSCEDVLECATSNGGCGAALYWTCNEVVGGPRTCTDVKECLTNNGGCGNAQYWLCSETVGGPPTCSDINECATANGGCGQLCVNSPGGFACDCLDGYSLGVDGFTCGDDDECASANGGCAQLCQNGPGTYACDCTPGYVLNADGLTCDDVEECATDNGGCGDPLHWTCLESVGGSPSCEDVLECETDNGDCGNATFWTCVENEGAAPDCEDVLECETDNGGCGDATLWTCVENEGAAPDCEDVLECATDNGGCGDPLYWICVEHAGASQSCTDVLECATDNGGCGDAAFWTCVESAGAAPTCTDVPECAADNGGCGDVTFWDCVENEGAAPTCTDVLECPTDNGGCGDPTYWDCVENEGAAPTCTDVLECAADNGGCGDSLYATCVENEGAPATCEDVLECATDNGGCGDTTFWDCVENEGAPPTCSDIDECAVDNGGCGANVCIDNVGAPPDCDEVDECLTDNGGCQQLCRNLVEGFECACNAGYALNPDGVTCADVEECATNNGGCGEAQYWSCLENEGAPPTCEDVLECATDNGGCGDVAFWTCVENEGAPATCTDVLECAVENGGCGDALYWSCLENEGAPPTCTDVLECAADACGDPAFWICTENQGAAPTCADVLECATDNGGCGDALYWSCLENEGAAPTCTDVLECATDNGGCGDAVFWICTENQGATPTCADVLECAVDNGGCGDPLHWRCVENEGAAPTCDDIDECATDNGGCEHLCENTPEGSYTCDCDAGYALNADGLTCDDVDECATDNGGCGAPTAFRCTNNVGAPPTCQTLSDCWRGLTSCEDFNACTTQVCDITAGCVYTDAEGTCDDGDACTQTDTCVDGECVGSNPVACPSAGLCYGEGICDSNTGVCIPQALPNGTACNDNDHCTVTGTCISGVCTGLANLVCAPPPDDCHVSYCPPELGTCIVEEVADDTPCDDGNACTQASSCQAGVCTGEDPVTCAPLDECHVAGVCDPGTGLCSNPTGNDGEACDDENVCTGTSTCASGTCIGHDPVVCDSPPEDLCLRPDICDPVTGCGDPVPVVCAPACSIGGVPGTCNPETGFCSNASTGVSGCVLDDCAYGLCQNGRCDEPIPYVCQGACQPEWDCEPVSRPDWGIENRPSPATGGDPPPLHGGGGYGYAQEAAWIFQGPALYFGGDYAHAVEAGQCDPDAPSIYTANDPTWCGNQQGFELRSDGRLNDFAVGDDTLTVGGEGSWLTDRYVGFHQEVVEITFHFPYVRDFTTVTIGFRPDSDNWQAYSSLTEDLYPGLFGQFYEPIELEVLVGAGASAPRTLLACNAVATPGGVCSNDFVPTGFGHTAVPPGTRGEVTFELRPDGVQSLQAGGDTITLRIHNPWRNEFTPAFTALDEITFGDPVESFYGQCAGGAVCQVDGTSWDCVPRGGRDGVACDDASLCTTLDTCQSGACVGSEPLVCNTPAGECQRAQTCDPIAGCYFPSEPDGSDCTDGNQCTQTDMCSSGVCVGSDAVVCPPSGTCHQDGVCQAATGVCHYAPEPAGTVACTDGDACTVRDFCAAGACDGDALVCGCTPGVDCDPLGYRYSRNYSVGSHTYSDDAHGPYNQLALGALTDGIVGSDAFADDCDPGTAPTCQGIWAGFSPDQPLVLRFEFANVRPFDWLGLGLSNTQNASGVAQPPRVEVSFSDDGVSFGPPLVFETGDGTMPTVPVGTRAEVPLDLSGTWGRYVLIRIPAHTGWTLLDEVRFSDPCVVGTSCQLDGTCTFDALPDGGACGLGGLDSCVGGACTDCSQQGLTDCSGVCVDVSTDETSCGDCGNACFPGDSCHGGVCSDCSLLTENVCDEMGCQDLPYVDCGDGVCRSPTSLLTDRNHCGMPEDGALACANACPFGEECRGGACTTCAATGLAVDTLHLWAGGTEPSGPLDFVYCEQSVSGADPIPYCLELATGIRGEPGATDAVEHLGLSGCGLPSSWPAACNARCAADSGQTCFNGSCQFCTSSSGRRFCGTECVSFGDPNHCGNPLFVGADTCNNVCSPGQPCHANGCTGPCPSGQTDCGDPLDFQACVDTNTSMDHCGGCDQPCFLQGCVNGVCSQCLSDNDCLASEWCNAATGRCQADLSHFSPCTRGEQCAAGVYYDTATDRVLNIGLCGSNFNSGGGGGCDAANPGCIPGANPAAGGCSGSCPWYSPPGTFVDQGLYCMPCITQGTGTNPCGAGRTCYDRVPVPIRPGGYSAADPEPTDPTIWRHQCLPLDNGNVWQPCTSHFQCQSGYCETDNGQPPSGTNWGDCTLCAGNETACCEREICDVLGFPACTEAQWDTWDAACDDVRPGQVCNASCTTPLAYDQPCTHDEVCNNGRCSEEGDLYPLSRCLCTHNSQCPSGSSCRTADGVCVQHFTDRCDEDSDCDGIGIFEVCAAGVCI